MNTRESEFLQRLRATFLVEAREHLQSIAVGLLALERAGDVAERSQVLEVVFRHTHSLKGAARAANFSRIESISHGVEAVLALCKRRGRILGSADFDTLHRAFDLLTGEVDGGGVMPVGASADQSAAIVLQLEAMAAGESGATEQAPLPRVDSSRPGVEVAVPADDEAHEPVPGTPLPPVAPRPPAETETVRVAMPHLDRVLLAAEEMLTIKQAGAEHSAELQRMTMHFAEWNKQWLAAQAPLRKLRGLVGHLRTQTDPSSATAPNEVLEFVDWTYGFINAVESGLRAATRSATSGYLVAGKQVDELLEETKGLLMMPFSTVTEVMPKLVRDLARDQGKEVDLQITGSDVQLDKRVLEKLKDPLVHLVRNAIDHGMEQPALRVAAGKAERATLRIGARLVHGGKVEIVVADDGVGLDASRLRKAAISRGWLTEDAARELDDMCAIELAFRSDVSTSPIITEISGRGLGLAIVRECVEKLGGRVVVDNAPGTGALFRITLPQSLATFRGVLVQAAGQTFVIPTTHIERVARLPRSGLRTVSQRETLSIDGRAVAVAYLHDLLGLQSLSMGTPTEFINVVLMGGSRDGLALAVDDVIQDAEVLVKRLQRPLVRVRNVSGATVLASGKILPILNVADLLKTAMTIQANAPAAPAHAAGTAQPIARKILVAEDSITSRLLLKGILEASGCEVKTVTDGVEAFTVLRSEPFDLLVSDIEMPRLNGFDLTARIRADRKLADLPVVLVTALSSREDRERGIDVGANAYIAKGGFDQRELLDAIDRLAGRRERA